MALRCDKYARIQMDFNPKRVSARIKAAKAKDFDSNDPNIVLSSFKIRGKEFKNLPKGFVAIDQNINSIYMGYDNDNDGIIDANREAFARFTTSINPFDNTESIAEGLSDKYSKANAKGKIVFKPLQVGQMVVFDSFFDKQKINPPAKMNNGEALDENFTYNDLVNILLGSE